MNIVLLGANGRTGRLFLQMALASGHSVTGVVRSAKSLEGVQHERLTTRVGDVCDLAFLKDVLPGHDAVVSTVGPRSPTRSACLIYSRSGQAIAEAMQATGLKRVLLTSTALLFPPASTFDHALRWIARNNQKAAGLMEDRVREAQLDYTFARTGFLTNAEDAAFEKANNAAPEGSNSLPRLALANFLLIELDRSDHVGQVVGLCGKRAA
ncbi:MAG: NAD(P)H-binding protein [Pseudomonadota bacterium]